MPSRRHRDVSVVVGVCAIVLALGYVGKACRGFWHAPLSFVCHSDIRALYGLRGMDRDLFPYLHGELLVSTQAGPPVRYGLRPVDGANEYPVLTGILMWLPSLVSDGPDTYLLASMALLAPFGLATAWLLGRMTGRRALWWSASPILLLYAFHNWDLAVVAASVVGFWCWWRGRPVAAAICVGVGGALKLYPLLFLLPLVLEQIHERDRRGAIRAAAAGAGTFALINLPFVVLDPSGWAVAYRFQTLRRPNYDSLWGVLGTSFELDQGTITTVSTLAVVVVLVAVAWETERRARREGTYPFLPACAALLAGFLLVSKVHSPQFALWMVPLFVLVGIRPGWYALFVAGNVLLYLAIFAVSVWSIHARDVLVTWSVWGRTATFLLLVVVFLRARPAVSRASDPDEIVHAPAPAD
jgi:glycosyl transferase family 87